MQSIIIRKFAMLYSDAHECVLVFVVNQ